MTCGFFTATPLRADAPRDAVGTVETPRRLLFQLTPAAHALLVESVGAEGRTGIAALDARLAALRPTRVEAVFPAVPASEAKSAAGLDRIYSVSYEAPATPEAAASLIAGQELVYVEPDIVHRKTATWPDDPDVNRQWGHHNPVFPLGWTEDSDADAEIAWNYETGDPNRTIAILDSGIDPTHPELAPRLVAGYDFVNNDSDASDDEGHGTACAGIAAAAGDNGQGIAGVVWNARLMPVKVLDASGSGASIWIANGITWAVDNGADVLSLSLGSDTPSFTIENAANYAWSQGAILFASSGNDNDPVLSYPAGFANVMAVGSLSPCFERKNPSSCDGENWWGSNYGAGLDFLAPGVLIYTTDITGAGGYFVTDYYDSFNGTSSACPYAAGAALLVWSYHSDLTNAQLRDLLRASATDMGPAGYDVETGYGHINPASAIQARFLVDATGSLAGAANSQGVSWSDVDGDGDADLYVVNDGSANVYYRNDGGAFVNATAGGLGDAGRGASGVFGDADGDGDLDLYIARDGANSYYRNDAGSFVDATVPPLDNADIGTTGSWIDYDNDGDLDLYFANYGTENRILVNDGSGNFTDVTALPLGNARPTSGFAWGDYDGNGLMDLHLANEGADRLLRNEGGGVFTNQTGGLLDTATGSCSAWGDVDNDGDLDLFVGNADAENRLWRNQGGGSFTNVAAGTPLADLRDTRGCFFADFDNDGWIDLFTTNALGANQLWRNELGVSFTSVAGLGAIGDASDSRAAAWADYDRDGDPDWYVANADGANQLLRNDHPPLHHWLRVRLDGTASNDRGIGARVRVMTSAGSQIRELTAGNVFQSQDETVALFGLGGASTVDSLIVNWPSGTVDEVTGLSPVDREVTVVEGEGVVTSVEDGAVAASSFLGRNLPNPFSLETAIRFRLEEGSAVRLQVFSADGRLVRTLLDGARPAGEHLVVWDRRDETGGRAPSGVYYCRLRTGSDEMARSLVVLD